MFFCLQNVNLITKIVYNILCKMSICNCAIYKFLNVVNLMPEIIIEQNNIINYIKMLKLLIYKHLQFTAQH